MSKKRFILFALVAAIVLSFAGSAMASVIDFEWTGAGDGRNWGDPANWSRSTGTGGYPGSSGVNTDIDTVNIHGNPSILIGKGIGFHNRISEITVEGEGSGVVLELGRTLPFDLAAEDTNLLIEARSNLKITAAADYNDTDVPTIALKTDGSYTLTVDVLEGKVVTIDVPMQFENSSVLPVKKEGKGKLAFTKAAYYGPTTYAFIQNQDLLNVTIEDGVVEIPSDKSTDDYETGLILGDVTFDYGTNDTGNRFPTLKVTGNDDLYWPSGKYIYVDADYTSKNKTEPNATIEIERGVTLLLGYYQYGQLSTSETSGGQRLWKTGLGTLDLVRNAIDVFADNIDDLVVKAGTVLVPFGTNDNKELINTAVVVEKDATFASGGGEVHRTAVFGDPKDFTTSVRSFWGQLGSTLDIVSGNFDIYGNQSATRNSIISGDVIGKGTLGAVKLSNAAADTVVEVHGDKNTYSGGTWIGSGALVSFYKQHSLGTGPIVGRGGSVELAPDLSAASKWIDLPNKIELYEGSDGLTFNVPAGKIVKQALGVTYTNALLTKTGEGELILAGEGEGSGRGNVHWITSEKDALYVFEGTVVLEHDKAVGEAGVAVADGAVARAFNGFSGKNTFSLNDANATPTLNSAIGAVISSVTPALVTSESFNAEGDFAFQIYPKEPIKKGDTIALLKADEFDIDLAKFDATVTDVADKKFTTLAIAEGEGNTLELTAAKDIDVPTITATGLNVDAKANIAIVVKVASTTPISKNVTVISDIPGVRVSDVDVPGKTFTIYGVAPSTDTEIPVRVYVTTTGDWVTDTVDTDGITVYEDFVLKVGSGGDTPPTKNTEDFVVTGKGTNSEITADVTVLLKGADAGTVIPNKEFELKLYHVGTSETAPLETSGTLTSDENGKYTYVFNSKAPYGYDAPYIIEAVGDGLEPVRSERITTAAQDTPITGGSSGGCDAGLGVFGLIAATGAVALLRKKD